MAAPLLTRPRTTTSPPTSALADLRAGLAPRRGPARLLGFAAIAYLLAAAFHLAVFAFDDTPWAGAVSWRKPTVFALSLGLLLWTFGWVLDRLSERRKLAWSLTIAFIVSSTIELGVITLQQWRGRPSHFNDMATSDAVLFGVMGAMVGVMSLMLVALFIWSLLDRPPAAAASGGSPADHSVDRIAVWAGMALIMTGLGIGQWLLNLGYDYVARFNTVPESVIYGEAGVAKFPHAVAFHGIQVFIVLAVLLRRSDLRGRSKRHLMLLATASYTGILLFASTQTLGGRAPFDLDVISGALLAVSVAVLIATLLVASLHWLSGKHAGDPAIAARSRQ